MPMTVPIQVTITVRMASVKKTSAGLNLYDMKKMSSTIMMLLNELLLHRLSMVRTGKMTRNIGTMMYGMGKGLLRFTKVEVIYKNKEMMYKNGSGCFLTSL